MKAQIYKIAINIWPKLWAIILLLALIVLLNGCGASSGNNKSIVYRGTIVSEEQKPIANLGIYIFETAESGTTDENGQFIIESFRQFEIVGFFVQAKQFSNVEQITDIPASAELVELELIYDQEKNNITLKSVHYSTSPSINPTVIPEQPPNLAATPAPNKQPTPKESNFDSNGDTKQFGIPSGLKGNINRGRTIWSNTCSSCHNNEKTNRSYSAINSALKRIPQMKILRISNQQSADLTAYLNRSRR